MPDPPTWPPPPNIANPLAEHDEFLSVCVRSSTPKLPLSRLRLVMALRQETHQNLRYCRAIVYDFCDRHSLLMPATGIGAWLPFVFAVINFAAVLATDAVQYFLGQRESAAVKHLDRLAISSERLHIDSILVLIIVFSTSMMMIFIQKQQKKAKADAAEARAKVAAQ